jgi:ABC-type transport system substrate-binding protein
MVEAIGGMWKAAGVNVQLINIDRAAITSNRLGWDNHFTVEGTAADQATGIQNYGNSNGNRGIGVELPESDAAFQQASNTLNEAEQEQFMRKVGDINFELHHEVPLFWLPVEAAANPKVVAGWEFPGSITGSWSHVENLRAAR